MSAKYPSDQVTHTPINSHSAKLGRSYTWYIFEHTLQDIRDHFILTFLTSRLVHRGGSPPGLSTEVGRLPACPPRWVASRLVHRGGSPPGLSTELGRLPACPPRWVASRLVHRGVSPPGLSTEVGRLPACPPRWVASRLVHRGGSPPGLSTEVGRLPACPPRRVASRLVHRGGSPPGLSTEVGRLPACPPRWVAVATEAAQRRLSWVAASSIPPHITLHHVHVPELRSTSTVPQEQFGLGLCGLHHCYVAVLHGHTSAVLHGHTSAVLHGHTSAVFTSSGVMTGRVLQLSSV